MVCKLLEKGWQLASFAAARGAAAVAVHCTAWCVATARSRPQAPVRVSQARIVSGRVGCAAWCSQLARAAAAAT